MPVRSLNSSVLKWPDKKSVDREVRLWAGEIAKSNPQIAGIGYFGSYARGDWGVGSDLDLIVIVDNVESKEKMTTLDATTLPVPADVLIYTQEEWDTLPLEGRFFRTVMNEIIWVYESII
ncbi:MAG: nucleotidyltransferase domain-containing protein [Deltaproteobacteria bacterium]|nr:nucleotidyltransferase domain-containing protein [Deltaproteobacteria bacterium]